MSKYEVTLLVSGTTSITVEAESEEEARDLAYREAYVSLCHQCSEELEVSDDYEVTDCRLLDDDEDEYE